MSFRCSHACLLVILALCSAAWRDPPILAIEADRQLSITEVPAHAPATIEMTGEAIVPIAWHRGAQASGILPLLLLPGAGDSIEIQLLSQHRTMEVPSAELPHVTIDGKAYDKLANWRPTSSIAERKTTLLLAAGFSVTLLLAALVNRGRAGAIVGVVVIWAIGLSIAASRRPTLIIRDETDGSRWFQVTQAQTLRVSIRRGEPWVPVVESVGQLKTLSPRIEVDGDTATLELMLTPGGKVGFRLSS